MATIRRCYAVEFTTREGVRIEVDGDGWRVLNPRQLGHEALRQAEQLIERAELHAAKAPADQLKHDEFLGRAEYAARRLDLRITHRRMKVVEPPMR